MEKRGGRCGQAKALTDFHRWKRGDVWNAALKEGRPCADCGGCFPAPAMQWDHLPGTEKVADVANLLRRLCKDRVPEEIAKRELVCANCHAGRTVSRRAIGA